MSSALELDDSKTNTLSSETEAVSTVASSLNLPGNARIILAHEDAARCELSKTLFSQAGWAAKLKRCTSLEDLHSILVSDEWDLVITYANSEHFVPAVLAKSIQSLEAQRQPALIYIDDQHCPTSATEIIRCGFSDYLSQQESDRLVFSAAREVFARQNQRIAATSETVIAEAQAKSQLLLSSTDDAIAYASDGMLIHANQQLCKLLGFSSSDDLELQPLIDLVTAEETKNIRALIKKMNNGQHSEMEPVSVALLTSTGESVKLTLSFDSATHDSEACTQIIFRDTQATAVKEITAPAIQNGSTTASAITTSTETIVRSIESLEGKGLVGFLSTCKVGQIRKAVGFYQHQKLGHEITDIIRKNLPENTIVGEYLSDNWLFALNDENSQVDVNELGSQLCDAIDKHLSAATGLGDISFTALGLAKFGIADVIAAAAIDKAFIQCAELQQGSGGYKVFAPRIDNAEGSAALKSALELDRLVIKFQPVISLQNQTTQHYQGHVFLRNDAGQEITATQLVDDLGLEQQNVALDHWLIEQAIEKLKITVSESPETCLTLPLTASALVADDFYQWVGSIIDASGLDPKHLAFDIASEMLHDYEQAATLLVTRLRAKGFAVSLSNIKTEDLPFICTLRPNTAKLAGELTRNLSAEEELNSRAELKTLIGEISAQQVQCVATQVSSAAELAQLWQTGVPLVQGEYLQAPLSTMNYEFSDIA